MRKYHIILFSILVVALASCSGVRYASDSNAEFDDIYYVSSDSDPVEVTLEDDYAGYHTEKNAPQEDYWEEEDTRDYANTNSGTGDTYIYNNYSNSPWGMSPNPYYGWGNYPGFTFNVGYNNFYHRWRPHCGISYGFTSYYPFAGSYFYGYSPYYNPWYYNAYYDPFYNPIGYCYNPWIYNPYWSGYAYGYGGYNYGYGYGSDVVFTGNGAYYGQHSGFNTGSLVNSTYTQGTVYNQSGKIVAAVKPIDPNKPAIDRPISAINPERPTSGNATQGRPGMNVERPTNPAIRPVSPDSRPPTGVTRPANPQRPSSPKPSTRPAQPDRPSGGTRPAAPSNNNPARPSKGRSGGNLIGALMEIGASAVSSARETNSSSPRSSWSNQSGSKPSVSRSNSSSSRTSTKPSSSGSTSRSARTSGSSSSSKSTSRSSNRR